MKIGHFEILSELSKSATGMVYKANDPETSQTVALKAISLTAFGDQAAELQKCLLEEVEATKVLSNPNLTPVFGAGEMEGQFCAAMEYIQGNSVATMLARKEGFSIWDLLDIGRQVCSGLDHAHAQNIFHYSLEPAKIMCGWDGTIRVLGFGVSSVGKFTAQMAEMPSILHYMSPEQIRGEKIDARSNIFSLGALFYEMVTDRKAFDREDSESLRESILESNPVPPMHVNAKLHPVLSDLIVKALAKDPAERYQNGRELLDDLERCKESKPQAAKAAVAAKATPANAEPQPKFASAPPTPAQKKPAAPAPLSAPKAPEVPAAIAKPEPAPKAAAAAAGAHSTFSSQNLEASNQPSASMSSAVLDDPATEAPSPQRSKIAVDPMMAGEGPSRGGKVSFSEMTELPPLKEIYTPPPAPTPQASQQEPEFAPNLQSSSEPEKPRIQTREVAEKALKEIKNVPPSLLVYSIAGAAVLILIIAVALVLHINHLNSDEEATRPAPVSDAPAPSASPKASQPAAPSTAIVATTSAPPPEVSAPVSQPTAAAAPAPAAAAVPSHVAVSTAKSRGKKKAAAPVVAAVIPGLVSIDSTPQGAQIQIDGKSDPS